ncbi:head GIN domain-containing protein [Telluria beijingensis]|uniref:head GIN domain-containing protein n=1 Tax=Telluria beijingensis TaxID=3068633 RepID=UPI00279544DB|nr:head GIN domain-containing protein [Massilia sp. REN29]
MRIGFALLVLSAVLIALSYSMLRATGTSTAAERREVAQDTRSVPAGVEIVEVDGPIDLNLRYGATPALQVSGEQRMLGNVEVSADGKVLQIGIRGMVLRHREPLVVDLTLPALSAVTIDGSGDSSINGFSGDEIAVQLNGSGSVRFNGRFRTARVGLSGSGDLDVNGGAAMDRVETRLMGSGRITVVGTARELDASTTGSGHLDAEHLRADEVTVNQSGSGDSAVQARSKVKVSLAGSGDVEVYGNPAERSTSRAGSGSVSYHE